MPSPLARKSVDAIDAYWADSFGCPIEALRPERTLVVPHAAHVGFDGAYAMTFGSQPIIAVPRDSLSDLQRPLSAWTKETIGDSSRARK